MNKEIINSRYPLCSIACISNALKSKGYANINEDLLFGLSNVFSFNYNAVEAPLSGEVVCLNGINYNAFLHLANALNLQYKGYSSEKKTYLSLIRKFIGEDKTVIVDVSAKEYSANPFADELFMTIQESTTNHMINIINVDEHMVCFFDSYSTGIQQLSTEEFLSAAFPKTVGISPARGRIHVFSFLENAAVNVNNAMIAKSLHYTAKSFLFGQLQNFGMCALEKFLYQIAEICDLRGDERKRTDVLYKFFSVHATNGSFFRKNFLRYLRIASTMIPDFHSELLAIIEMYKSLHNKWRVFNRCFLNRKDGSCSELQRQLKGIIETEYEAMSRLLCITDAKKNWNSIQTVPVDIQYEFVNMLLDKGIAFEYYFTNEVEDILQYCQTPILFYDKCNDEQNATQTIHAFCL